MIKSTPAAFTKSSPAFAPTPKTPELTGTAALIVERLSKLENESRELRELVLQLSGGTPIPLAGLDDTADNTAAADPELECGGCDDFASEGAIRAADEHKWIRTSHVGSLPRAKGDADVGEVVRMQRDLSLIHI